MRLIAALGLVCFAAVCTPALAQPPGPPGPYVIDVRGTTTDVPNAPEFYPSIPLNTFVPGRGFGIDVGGHVYLAKLGASRIGLGANVIRIRGTAPPPVLDSAVDVTPTATIRPPSIRATFSTIAPQLSFNFGTRSGWSYLSAGLGVGEIVTTAVRQEGTTRRSSGQRRVINMGGGARWFLRSRFAVGFDIRVHRVSAGPITPGTSLLSASAGLSFR